MDFFTVLTLSLRVLYGLFIIDHGRIVRMHSRTCAVDRDRRAVARG